MNIYFFYLSILTDMPISNYEHANMLNYNVEHGQQYTCYKYTFCIVILSMLAFFYVRTTAQP